MDQRLCPISLAPRRHLGGGITPFLIRQEPIGKFGHVVGIPKIRNPAGPLCQDPGMPALRRFLAVLCALTMLTGCAPGALPAENPASTTDTTKADAVMRIVRDTMAAGTSEGRHRAGDRRRQGGRHPGRRRIDDRSPATTAMHFRNGAVAISYVATLLLELVDEQKVSLDDKLSKWLPEVPHADRVTLGQLAQMTSGYVDYVIGNTSHERGALRKPVPALDRPRHPQLRHLPAAALRARHQLELRPHQLCAARTGAGEGHRPGNVEAVVGQGTSASRADEHRQLAYPRDPVAGAARVQL